MSLLYRLFCGLLGLLVRGGGERELEIIVLRHQLAILKRGGSGPSTRPSTEPCSPRPAGCFLPSGGRALRSAHGRFAAGTGRCSKEIGNRVTGPVVPRLRRRRAA
jgi:hypothetical protein